MALSPATLRLLEFAEQAGGDGRSIRVPLATLLAATDDFRPTQHPVGRARIMESVGHPTQQLLVVRGQVVPKTDPSARIYRTSFSFFKVHFNSKRTRQFPIRVENKDGLLVHAERVREDYHPVRVRCSCKDYYFTWWWWNNQNKSHSGPRLPKYVRKTDTYPERNPLHIPGL